MIIGRHASSPSNAAGERTTEHNGIRQVDATAKPWPSSVPRCAAAHSTLATALTRHARALDLLRGLGDRFYEADTLARIGDTHHTAATTTPPAGPGNMP